MLASLCHIIREKYYENELKLTLGNLDLSFEREIDLGKKLRFPTMLRIDKTTKVMGIDEINIPKNDQNESKKVIVNFSNGNIYAKEVHIEHAYDVNCDFAITMINKQIEHADKS